MKGQWIRTYITWRKWGHRLVRRACELKLLNSGQHGSVPRRTTMDPIMLTQLTTDLCRILKHDLARFDNDASACFDRIIVALGMLAARRCGMPKNAIQVHADALHFMQYTVKTIYGISADNYHGTGFEPLFGTGQGSGASPSVWLTLVVLMLNTLDRIIPDRMNFVPIQGQRPHSRLVDAFVDDTSLGFTSAGHQNYEQLINRLQEIAQTWEHILFLSGGKLNLSKCSWYVLSWEWKSGRPRLRPILPTDPTISLYQGNQKEASEIKRTDPRHRHACWGISQSHGSIYIPSMRYSLPALAVDEEALGGIQSKVVQVMLQRMHVCSTIPTSIRHGPVELGGLGIYDLRTEAGLEALKFFRNAIYSDSEVGNLLRINLQYSQLESGIGEPLLEHPGIHLPYLTPSWIMSLRQYLFCHKMTVKLTDSYEVHLASSADQYIMQPEHLQRYTSRQQQDLNLVRLYLQVTTLAEMSDPDRPNAIKLDYLDARRPTDWTPDHHWPRQDTPSSSQRRLWKRYITSLHLRYIPFWKVPPTSFSRKMATTQHHPPTNPHPTSFATLKAYLHTLPRTQRRLLSEWTQQATDIQVWRAFRSRARLHLATDGGLLGTQSTHGWILATSTTVLFTGSGPVDGPFELASSTRSELGGLAASLLLIVGIARFWGLRHKASIRCMGKGHQDDNRSYDRLPRSARMNIDADFLATRYRNQGRFQSTPSVDHQESQKVSFTINGLRINNHFDDSIRYHINGYHLRQYLQEQHSWSDSTWQEIDFSIFGKFFRRSSPSKQIRHTKFVHDQLPLGIRRYQQARIPDASLKLCPCCKNHDETATHLLRCPNNPAYRSSIHELCKKIQAGEPHSTKYLIAGVIRKWSSNTDPDLLVDIAESPSHLHPIINSALQSQTKIGWDLLLKGYFSTHWRTLASMDMYNPTSFDNTKGEAMMLNIMTAIADHFSRLWAARNEVLHAKHDNALRDSRSAEISEVRHYFSRPHLLRFDDRHYCEGSLEALLNGKSSTRRRWLRQVKKSIELQEAQSSRQSLITSYFTTTNRNATPTS
ncbi:hypothetical protein MHU86_20278 [Fragilaria crotonensis]|nr:hypothetical protein MHU86_20278 [Fragilaria crotonensis]